MSALWNISNLGIFGISVATKINFDGKWLFLNTKIQIYIYIYMYVLISKEFRTL